MIGLNFCLSQQALRGWGFERGYTVKKNLNKKVWHTIICQDTHMYSENTENKPIQRYCRPPDWVLLYTIYSFARLQSLFPCVANLWTQFPAVHSAVTLVGEDRWMEHRNISQEEERKEITVNCSRRGKCKSVCDHDGVSEYLPKQI